MIAKSLLQTLSELSLLGFDWMLDFLVAMETLVRDTLAGREADDIGDMAAGGMAAGGTSEVGDTVALGDVTGDSNVDEGIAARDSRLV